MKEHSSIQRSFYGLEHSPRGLRKVGSAGCAFVLAAGLLVVAPAEAVDSVSNGTESVAASTVDSPFDVESLTAHSTEVWPGIVDESGYRGRAAVIEALDGQSSAAASTSTSVSSNASPSAFSLASYQQEVLRLVNIERAKAGVAAMVLDPGEV